MMSTVFLPHYKKMGVLRFIVISKINGDISSHSKEIVSLMEFVLFIKLFLPTLFLLK